MEKGVTSRFGPALLCGLAELGPVDPFSGDLSLELGVSVWLRRSGTSLVDACGELFEARTAILEASAMDPDTEPVPFVGRSPRLDVVNLALYVGDLLRRAAATSGTKVQIVAERAIGLLAEPAEAALGA